MDSANDKSVAQQLLDMLTAMNETLAEVKEALGKPEPQAKGKKEAKATETEWTQRLARNQAAGRTMETARFYCAGSACSYACYHEPKIDAHITKRGGDHVKHNV